MNSPNLLSSIWRTLVGVLVIAGLSYGTYAYVEDLKTKVPCSEPLTYHMGELDPRFGVTETEFASRVREAVAVWNKEAGREILREDANGEVSVSLIFDERQQAVALGSTISTEQETYARLEATLNDMIATFEASKNRHDAVIEAYSKDADAYEAEVSSWNAKGGAPAGVYERLQKTQSTLKSRERAINAETERLNRVASDINAEVKKLNEYAKETNQKVHEYNSAVGEEFDQGLFTQDKEGKRITIYEYKTKAELVRVLAHEFGHALGLDHVENPSSLMYPYNTGTSLELSEEDREAFTALCAES
ncbi:MAG: matrixin family metalloprotease [Candidatus Pacebacteria bacterium]|nr:matrixin family metalloprotease [Candidatus Paceibacterota bacterium]